MSSQQSTTTQYLDLCNIKMMLNDGDNLKLLYRLCYKSKIEAVNVYMDSNSIYVTGESYLTGMVIFYKVRGVIKSIRIPTGEEGKEYDVRIDNRAFITNPDRPRPTQTNITNQTNPDKSNNKSLNITDLREQLGNSQGKQEKDNSTAHNQQYQEFIREELDGINKKTYIRFGITTNFLQALSLYGGKDIEINILARDLILNSDMTRLHFDKVRTMMDLSEYLNLVVGISWDKLNINGITDIAKALARARDSVYRQYIAIEEDKIYSHNSTFLIEVKSDEVRDKYVLPYTTIDMIKMLPAKSKSYIGIKNNYLYIEMDSLFLMWDTDRKFDDTDNLLTLIKKDNFMKFAVLDKDEWSKFELLKTYSELDSDQDITVKLDYGYFFLEKDENKAVLKAKIEDTQLSFLVGIDTLMLAKFLCGDNPVMYVDMTQKESVLILYGSKLVAIRIDKLKIDKVPDRPRLLSKAVESADYNYNLPNLNKIPVIPNQPQQSQIEPKQPQLPDTYNVDMGDISVSINVDEVQEVEDVFNDMDDIDLGLGSLEGLEF